MLQYGSSSPPSSGELGINASARAGRKPENFIAKFGRYVSIKGASEDPDKNIS
jgi:hypothetical protein